MNEQYDGPEFVICDEQFPGMPPHQVKFDEILDAYNDGIEPLENWSTEHLVQMSNAIDAELQERAYQSGK